MITLSTISNDRIRNIVRGIVATSDSSQLRTSMENLRKEGSAADITAAYRFLHSSKLANHLQLPESFPSSVSNIIRIPIYSPARLEVELAHQSVKLTASEDLLVQAIHSVEACNLAAIRQDSSELGRLFEQHFQEFGVSLFMMLKAISLRQSSLKDSQSTKALSDYLGQFLSPRRQFLAAVFEDYVDKDIDYLRPRRACFGFLSKRQLRDTDAPIVADVFSGGLNRFHNSSEVLQAYGRWSALDTVAQLFRMIDHCKLAGDVDLSLRVRETIPEAVRSAWQSAFKSIDIKKLGRLLGGDPEFAEKTFFVHSPAWSEYPKVLQYRQTIENSFGDRLNGSFPAPSIADSPLFARRSTVGALLKSAPIKFSISRTDPQTCGHFHRTTSLIASLATDDFLRTETGENLLSLLDTTMDVARLFGADELNRLIPPRPNDLLYSYLRAALINDADDCKLTQHALRRAIQKITIEQYKGDIVEFIKSLDTEVGHVSEHLFNACTEYFLTELYDLYSETDQVTEAQARLLEWYGEARRDEASIERAKSQRLNLLLRKVRGNIDDTRIYVDPLRFIQWLQDNIGPDLRGLSGISFGNESGAVYTRSPVAAFENPRTHLFQLLDKSYAAFCNDKYNGVDSYIGRRIRHGTLHGLMVSELRPLIESSVSEFQTIAPNFSDFLVKWFARYDTSIRAMAAEELMVRSKDRNRGLIVPSLDDTEKSSSATSMINEVASALEARTNQVNVLAYIHEYCWLLFEIDLKRIRKAFDKLESEHLLNPNEHRIGGNVTVSQRITDRVRQINTEIQHRFQTVQSWLTRPTNISPSATIALLFQAVLDEIKSRYTHLTLTPVLEGDTDVDLFGHRFHFFYDILYVLVDNAAKHGGDGEIAVKAATAPGDMNTTLLSVTVASSLHPDFLEESIAQIRAAMCSEIGDAFLQINKSGLRKIRCLVDDANEIVDFKHRIEDSRASFTITMRYPRS